jgi:hypothetical protein
MKTRNANDIRRDLQDAKRRLRELEANGNAAVPVRFLSSGFFADDAISCLGEIVDRYERELEAATRFGEQMVFAF